MKNFHVLQIIVVEPTDNESFKIRIKSERFKTSILIDWPETPGKEVVHSTDFAAEYLTGQGFNILGKGEGNSDHDYLITDSFRSLKKQPYTFSINGRPRLSQGKFYDKKVTVKAYEYNDAVTALLENWNCNYYHLIG